MCNAVLLLWKNVQQQVFDPYSGFLNSKSDCFLIVWILSISGYLSIN